MCHETYSMFGKHFTDKFGAIINLHKTMNVCPFDVKVVQGWIFFKTWE